MMQHRSHQDPPNATKLLVLITLIAAGATMVVATVAFAAQSRFQDVPDSSVFLEDIEWLADAEVTLGCDDGLFCPSDHVSRQQMAAFMHRLAINRVVDAATVEGQSPQDFFQVNQQLTRPAVVVGDKTYIGDPLPVVGGRIDTSVELVADSFGEHRGDTPLDLVSGPALSVGLVIGYSCPTASDCPAITRSASIERLAVRVAGPG